MEEWSLFPQFLFLKIKLQFWEPFSIPREWCFIKHRAFLLWLTAKKKKFSYFRDKLKWGKWLFLDRPSFPTIWGFFQTPSPRLKYLGYHRDQGRKRDFDTQKEEGEVSAAFQNISCWKVLWYNSLNLVMHQNWTKTVWGIIYYYHLWTWMKKFFKNYTQIKLSSA